MGDHRKRRRAAERAEQVLRELGARSRAELCGRDREELALVAELLFLQSEFDDLHRFDIALARFALVNGERSELTGTQSTPHADIQAPTLQEVVDERELARDLERVVPGQHHHHRAEVDSFRPAGHVTDHGQRIRRLAVRRGVVLGRPDRVESEWFGEIGQPENALPGDGVRRRGGSREVVGLVAVRPIFVVQREQRETSSHSVAPITVGSWYSRRSRIVVSIARCTSPMEIAASHPLGELRPHHRENHVRRFPRHQSDRVLRARRGRSVLPVL